MSATRAPNDPELDLFLFSVAAAVVTGRQPTGELLNDTAEFQRTLRSNVAEFAEATAGVDAGRLGAILDRFDLFVGGTRHRQSMYREVGQQVDEAFRDFTDPPGES